jgi:thiamine pyrophosphate-dependent acetolactate synthase large subunit-like protein
MINTCTSMFRTIPLRPSGSSSVPSRAFLTTIPLRTRLLHYLAGQQHENAHGIRSTGATLRWPRSESNNVFQTRRAQSTSSLHHDQRAGTSRSLNATGQGIALAPAGDSTAAYAFFEALWELGITHCFVNLGSDHPAIIEAMIKGLQDRPERFPRMITCPTEIVAMSMADGYARYTGKPQCVLVHVDVGTQALGVALHNAEVGRAPVFIFAGMSPFTQEGELLGSRTEWMHWQQDVHNQEEIVRQYCRYTNEVKTGRNIKQMVARSLQFAKSAPAGPVYLCAAREVLEEQVPAYDLKVGVWEPAILGGLPDDGVADIAKALAEAESPLLITGLSGRNHQVPVALVELADRIPSLRVLDTGGAELCFPADHPAWLGMTYGVHPSIAEADVILVLDCEVPWVPTKNKPRREAKIFHIDADPLKNNTPLFYLEADASYRADALVAIRQINSHVKENRQLQLVLQRPESLEIGRTRQRQYEARLATIAEKAKPHTDDSFGSGYLASTLRKLCPEDTVWTVQVATNTSIVHDNLQVTRPGHFINCGGGGLGWSGGAALGIKLASEYENIQGLTKDKFVVQITGDGNFIFNTPSSVHWVARRYGIPTMTVILNNGGEFCSDEA